MMKRAFLSVTFMAYATTSLAQVHVQTIRGRFCTAAAPAGWTVTAENPTGSAFGADLTRSGGAAVASYLIFGVPAQMRSSPYYQQWYVTPERAVMAHLTQFGSKPMNCDRPAELLAGSGYMGMACQSQALKDWSLTKCLAWRTAVMSRWCARLAVPTPCGVAMA